MDKRERENLEVAFHAALDALAAAEARAEKYREQLLRTHDALYIAEPAAEHCNICRTLFPDPRQERDAGAEG